MSYERPAIQKIEGYVPGEQLRGDDIIKLNTNENPYPAAPAVAAALRQFSIADLRRYPPPLADDFRRCAAQLHGVSVDNIIPTNGGDELLRLVLTTYVDPGDTVLVTDPTYSLYSVLADLQGARLEQVPLQEDWSMPPDFSQRLAASHSKLCMLVNPHAPTGRLLDADYLARLATAYRGILLLDEAYVDFVDPALAHDTVTLLKRHENLLLLRTLSKGYSLAGLRFGYGIAAAELIQPMLYKTRDSYNTDTIAQRLAVAALESVDYARQTWARIRQQRESLTAALNARGLITVPSQSNFVLTQIPGENGAEQLYQALKGRGILLRHFPQGRLLDKLRITVGTEAENEALLNAIDSERARSDSGN